METKRKMANVTPSRQRDAFADNNLLFEVLKSPLPNPLEGLDEQWGLANSCVSGKSSAR